MEYKTEIIQHVFKMLLISLLPRYIKWISMSAFDMPLHMQM